MDLLISYYHTNVSDDRSRGQCVCECLGVRGGLDTQSLPFALVSDGRCGCDTDGWVVFQDRVRPVV